MCKVTYARLATGNSTIALNFKETIGLYIPSSFALTDRSVCHRLIQNNPLGTLFISHEDGLAADHIPLILHTDDPNHATDLLLGHIARANPLAKKAQSPLTCLTVFQGINHYISPNGYATKQDSGKVVPTWNYEAVHVHGTIRLIDDPAWLLGFLERLTNTHESSQPTPWHVQDAPADYIESLLQAIVGIEITVDRYEGKLKLSQNQPASNRHSLSKMLKSSAAPESQKMGERIAEISPRIEPVSE